MRLKNPKGPLKNFEDITGRTKKYHDTLYSYPTSRQPFTHELDGPLLDRGWSPEDILLLRAAKANRDRIPHQGATYSPVADEREIGKGLQNYFFEKLMKEAFNKRRVR